MKLFPVSGIHRCFEKSIKICNFGLLLQFLRWKSKQKRSSKTYRFPVIILKVLVGSRSYEELQS